MAKELFKTIQGKRIKKTPEEIAQEEREGMEFIQQRGRKEEQLMKEGLTGRQLREEAGKQISRETELGNVGLQARLKLEQQAAEANVTQALLQQEIAKQNAAKTQPQTAQTQPSQITQEQEIIQPQPLEQEIIENFKDYPGLSAKGISLNIQKSIKDIKERGAAGALGFQAKETFEDSLSAGANFYFNLRSLIAEGKPYEIAKLEGQFKDTNTIILKGIEDVKSGQRDYYEVYKGFSKMEGVIRNLERVNQNTGIYNLYYWTDKGATTALEIDREIEIMENLKLDLLTAKRTAELNRAKAAYGLPQELNTQQVAQEQ
jgi:hypothetical protein